MLEVSDRLIRRWRIGDYFESTEAESLRGRRNGVVCITLYGYSDVRTLSVSRLDRFPDGVVHRLLIDPAMQRDLASSFEYFIEVNKVHIAMLQRVGELDARTASDLNRANDDILREGAQALPFDAKHEDLYFTIEAAVIAKVGPEIGGSMHTGRSRNDILATIARMRMREELIEVLELVNRLRDTALSLADRHECDVVSGYTHLQAAEPITLAHYFAALIEAIQRDHQRILATAERANQCPLGSGAMASTTFPLDRDFTAKALGFDGPMDNSLDGVASRDYAVEALGALAILTNNLSRFGAELQVWATAEFGYLEVDADIAVTSSIMPQKKNPVTLEHVKAKAAHVEAAWISSLTALKSAPYSHSRESSVESLSWVWNGIAEAKASIELFTHTLEHMTFDTELMRHRASMNFSCVTELANGIVREHDLSFRTAHHIIGTLVKDTLAAGKTSESITVEDIAAASEDIVGYRLQVSEDMVGKALDPNQNAQARVTRGGPATKETGRQRRAEKDVLARDRASIARLIEQRKEGQAMMNHLS